MGKLKNLAGAVETIMGDITDALRTLQNKELPNCSVIYVGEDCEIEEAQVLASSGTKSKPRPRLLLRGDRIVFASGNDLAVTIECRHKLTSGDTQRDVLLISAKEWLDLVRMATHDWKNQKALATLHKRQGHA